MENDKLSVQFTEPLTFDVGDRRPTEFIIFGAGSEDLVRINLKDGSMIFGPNYTPEGTAKVFWEAISNEYKVFLKWKAEQQT